MKRFTNYLGSALALLVMAVGLLSSSVPVSAAGSAGLSIQPRKNYTIKPGQTITDKMTVGNLDSTDDLTLSLRMIDFTYTDQSGTPKLDLAEGTQPTSWSLRSFTTLPKTITVPKGSSKTFSYSITIPKDQGAGSYYSAIYYQASGSNGGNVALNASGVSLVFVSVPGQVKESMTLQKLGAYNSADNGTTGSFVFIDTNQQPNMIAFTLKNEGNVFESPAGDVTITDMFGHSVADVQTNPNQSLALLGQSRLFASCIKTVQAKIQAEGGTSTNTSCTSPGLKPGRYTAKLDVFYGQNGNETHEVTSTVHFWYLPWWFIIAVIVLILAIVLGIWWLQRKIKAAVKGTTYKSGRGISRKIRR